MLTALVITVAVLLLLGAGGAFLIPILVIGGLIWLLLWPIRFAFHLVFAIIGGVFHLAFGLVAAVLGVLLAPVVLVIGGIALLGGLVVALLALLTPLIPIAVLAMLGWGVYRLVVRPSVAA